MITIFTIPKSFETPHISVIQKNGIKSWLYSCPQGEIILVGDDPGVREASIELGVKHLPEIERNEYGTPLVNSAFHKVEQISQHKLLCYANCDVLFPPELEKAIRLVRSRHFLMIGRRWNLDWDQPIEFSNQNWGEHIYQLLEQNGVMESPQAMDYFIFPTGTIKTMPPFAVGRPGWDNWLVYFARSSGYPVVDITSMVKVIHQNHNYTHVKNSTGPKWEGPEAEENNRLADNKPLNFGIFDATHILAKGKLVRTTFRPYIDSKINHQNSLHSSRKFLDSIRRWLFWRIFHRRSFIPEKLWFCFAYFLSP